jgi:hypothetical protein
MDLFNKPSPKKTKADSEPPEPVLEAAAAQLDLDSEQEHGADDDEKYPDTESEAKDPASTHGKVSESVISDNPVPKNLTVITTSDLLMSPMQCYHLEDSKAQDLTIPAVSILPTSPIHCFNEPSKAFTPTPPRLLMPSNRLFDMIASSLFVPGFSCLSGKRYYRNGPTNILEAYDSVSQSFSRKHKKQLQIDYQVMQDFVIYYDRKFKKQHSSVGDAYFWKTNDPVLPFLVLAWIELLFLSEQPTHVRASTELVDAQLKLMRNPEQRYRTWCSSLALNIKLTGLDGLI